MGDQFGKATPQERPPFASAFRGYNRDDVDAYLTRLERQLHDVHAEVTRMRQEAERRRVASAADLENATNEVAAAREAAVLEAERLASDLRVTQAQLAQAQQRLSLCEEESGRIQEVLLTAHQAAQEVKQRAQIEAEAMLREAEARAVRLDEETRARMQSLRFEFDQARRDFDEFLSNTRNLAHSFIRKIDEARTRPNS
jgi:DivIVA domain-containing protein